MRSISLLMLRSRVKRGATWLDKRYPDWRDKIDLARLNMDDCLGCVLGQLFGNYHTVIGRTVGPRGCYLLNEQSATKLGFNESFFDIVIDEREEITEYYALDELWREEITKKKPVGAKE